MKGGKFEGIVSCSLTKKTETQSRGACGLFRSSQPGTLWGFYPTSICLCLGVGFIRLLSTLTSYHGFCGVLWIKVCKVKSQVSCSLTKKTETHSRGAWGLFRS